MTNTALGSPMDDYDSGDDLLDGLNPDELIQGKRGAEDDQDAAPPTKRARQVDTDGSVDLTALARGILREKFGYDEFRHEQEKAIGSILRGDNTLVIFPTGGGKSLCYQVCTQLL